MFECIQENTGPLLGSIRAYVVRMGLASGAAAREIADEVLQETVIEALAHAENHQAKPHPMAWLRGIALNVIRRKRTALATRGRRESPLTLLAARYPEAESEQALLEQWGPITEHGLDQEMESNEQVGELLALVASKDQQVLILSLLAGFEAEELAQRLGTTPGTARMRLHRALTRLRAAWFKRAANSQGDAYLG
jgi:RNA polymerase sigma factor (sigma-70 family)